MKTIRFPAYPDGYKCSEPGEQSGDYVKLSDAQARVEESLRLEREKTTPIILAREARIAELEKALEQCRIAFDGVGTTESERTEWIGAALNAQSRAAEVLKKGKQ